MRRGEMTVTDWKEQIAFVRSMSKPAVHYRHVFGLDIMRARESTGLNQAEFADQCGWSQQYQQQLERPVDYDVRTVTVTVVTKKAVELLKIKGKQGRFYK